MLNFFKETAQFNSLIKTANQDDRAIVFYSELGIYYQYFQGYIDYLLEHSHLNIYYLTSDPCDPVFSRASERFRPFYLKAFLSKALENLNVTAIAMTMPELGRFHVKRSKFPVNHVYFFHAMGSTHLQYAKGAFDQYDTIFCVGAHQVAELRKAEKVYRTPEKNLFECGYAWLEKLYSDHRKLIASNGPILIAPSWHKGNILDSCIDTILPPLNEMDRPIIVRPHSESFKRFPAKMKALASSIRNFPSVSLESELTSCQSILEASVLITDWSGISLEYALATSKPVLFIDTPMRIDNPCYQELDLAPMELTVREGVLGDNLPLNKLGEIRGRLTHLLENHGRFKEKIAEVREKYIFNWLESSRAGGDFLIDLYGKKGAVE